MRRSICLSVFTLLLSEQWEGVTSDEHPNLTELSMQRIHHTRTRSHSQTKGLQQTSYLRHARALSSIFDVHCGPDLFIEMEFYFCQVSCK